MNINIQSAFTITFLLMLFSLPVFLQEKAGTIKVKKVNVDPIEEGKLLFKKNCSVCHSEFIAYIAGPSLAVATKRALSMEWIIKWVKNSHLH